MRGVQVKLVKTSMVGLLGLTLFAGNGLAAVETPYSVETIAELRTIDMTGITNNTVCLVLGYYGPGDRGGGVFRWSPNSTTADDGGRYITNYFNYPGRWERMLNGERANVRMWGATGNGSTDDTAAIKRAIAASVHPWSMDLLFPSGTYRVSDTLVFGSSLHLYGEGQGNNAMILMSSNAPGKDVFMTQNAKNWLTGQSIDWDHWLVFENLYIKIEGTTAANTNAALTMCRPGEGHTIRNITTVGGGFGLRCYGTGAPGLKVINASTHSAVIAGISIEGLTSDSADGGPVSLIGISGDAPSSTSSVASLVRFYKCRPSVSISDLKAENAFGGGVIQYYLGGTTNYWDASTALGSLSVRGGTVNNSSQVEYATDYIVLKGDSYRTASVLVEHPNLYGVRNLIRDDVTGRSVEADVTVYTGLSQLATRVPIAYEGVMAYGVPRSRLVVGQTAICHFIPPTNGWYRVILPWVPNAHLAGSLVISSWRESTKIEYDVSPHAGTSGALITLARGTINGGGTGGLGWHPPVVTQARAGSYRFNGYSLGSFLDIYVENPIPTASVYREKEKRVTLALDINGMEMPDSGVVQLVEPYLVTQMFPPSITVLNSNQVSIVRP